MGSDGLADVDGLGQLTRREAEILRLRCQGLKIEALAAQLDPPITARAVYFHLGNIYEKLGLAGVDGYERLSILNAQICPRVLDALGAAPRLPADDEALDREASSRPTEATVALVVYDEARALIPQQDLARPFRAPVAPGESPHPASGERTLDPDGGRPMIDTRRRRKDALLVLAGAVFGIVLALAVMLPRQMTPTGLGSEPPAAVSGESSDYSDVHAARMAGNPPRLPRPQP